MSIACAQAEALHRSSGAPEVDKRVVEDALHGAVRGQMTATRARGLGTQYFTFDDEDAFAQALQWDEEVNVFLLAPLLDSQDQASVQEMPEVPVPSPVGRSAQPGDVEQDLNVPSAAHERRGLHDHQDFAATQRAGQS